MAVLATAAQKLLENVPGAFGVTDACIDCDLCRQTAPKFFKRQFLGNMGYSYVYQQPRNEQDEAACMEALRACPVEAIICDEEIL